MIKDRKQSKPKQTINVYGRAYVDLSLNSAETECRNKSSQKLAVSKCFWLCLNIIWT